MDGSDIRNRIKRGYKLALIHDPDQETIATLLGLYQKASFFYRKDQTKAIIMAGQKENAHEIAPMALVASAIINLDEFITKE